MVFNLSGALGGGEKEEGQGQERVPEPEEHNPGDLTAAPGFWNLGCLMGPI